MAISCGAENNNNNKKIHLQHLKLNISLTLICFSKTASVGVLMFKHFLFQRFFLMFQNMSYMLHHPQTELGPAIKTVIAAYYDLLKRDLSHSVCLSLRCPAYPWHGAMFICKSLLSSYNRALIHGAVLDRKPIILLLHGLGELPEVAINCSVFVWNVVSVDYVHTAVVCFIKK